MQKQKKGFSHMIPSKYTVASDFHGNAHALETILKQYNNTQLVLLGDFFDSRDSFEPEKSDNLAMAKVLTKLQTNQYNLPIKPIIIRGNHDEFMRKASLGDDFALQTWLLNGGIRTLKELQYNRSLHDTEHIRQFLNSHYAQVLNLFDNALLSYETDNIIFVHAGLDWDVPDPVNDTDDDTKMWIRGEYYYEADGVTPHRNFTNKNIVSGHTPQQFFDHNETTYTHDIVTLHNINDPEGINRYVIDGGSNSGASNQHVNIVQFNQQGNLLDIAIMH